MTGPPDEWDAGTYERVSAPQAAWGRSVIDRIALTGDEVVLDAGCGTGRVTRMLAERVPRGRVIAVDGSHAMVAEASRRLLDLAPRVEVRQADLRALDIPERVDLVVSTATFHWILDHDALFAALFATLRPGGRLVAQCGGLGNIAGTIAAADAVAALPDYSPFLSEPLDAWNFADPATTEERLRGAGFTGARAWLETAPARFATVADGAEFLATVVLRHHRERLPERLRGPFATAVAARRADADGRVSVDYVRLNMAAEHPGAIGASP